MSNELHEANRRRRDAAAEGWARGADARGLWRRCPAEPELVLCDRELAYLRGVAGQHVCVLGSGDNKAVAKALQDYGEYVADMGDAPFVLFAEPGVSAECDMAGVVEEIQQLQSLLRIVANNAPPTPTC